MRFAYAAIISLVAAVVLPYTAAAAQISNGFDVRSAIVAAEQELIELGISPSEAVFQIGARNYAGPSCPGEGWNCTNASTVVQIGNGTVVGSTDYFQCYANVGTATPGPGSCTIVQINTTGTNFAQCVESTSTNPANQSCNITQTNLSGTNQAFVNQVILQWQVEGPQSGTQTANVRQTNVTGGNESAAAQTVGQAESKFVSGFTGALQTQEAHQRLFVCQGGASPCVNPSTGTNKSGVDQNTFQLASVQFYGVATGVIVQNQNTQFGPKSRAEVHQTSTDKTNNAALLQFSRQTGSVHNSWSSDEDDSPPATSGFLGPVTQQQGNGFKCGNAGGLCGFEFQNSTGVQTAFERQDEVQLLVGPRFPNAASQTQYGDEFCCATQIGGNNANLDIVSQSKAQFHTSSFTEGFMQGHCFSPSTDINHKSCLVTQLLNQNGTTTNNTCNGASCNIAIQCAQGGDASSTCVPLSEPPLPPCPTGPCLTAIPGPEIAVQLRDAGPASG
jgi:hypothetical protein